MTREGGGGISVRGGFFFIFSNTRAKLLFSLYTLNQDFVPNIKKLKKKFMSEAGVFPFLVCTRNFFH